MSEQPPAAAPGRVSPGTTGPAEDHAELLAAYQRHLRAERNLSAHTVRAYLGDARSVLEHLDRLGEQPAQANLRSLRSWLAKQQSMGVGRATLQRRAASIRTLFRWLKVHGEVETSPAEALRSPKEATTAAGHAGS